MKIYRLFSLCLYICFCINQISSYLGVQRLDALSFECVDWDSMNILSWDWATEQGQRPFKDFWYPYFGRIYLKLYRLEWLYECIVVGVLYFCFLSFCNFKKLFTPIFFWVSGAAFFCQLPSAWTGSMRYLLGLSCAWLIWLSLGEKKKLSLIAFFAGSWLSAAFFFEPPQAVAVLMSLCPVAIFALIKNLKKNNAIFFGLPYFALGGVCATAIWSYFLYSQGNLVAFYQQIKNLSAHTNNSLWPVDLPSWWKFSAEPEKLVLLLSAAGLGIGFYGILSKKNESGKISYPLFISALFATMIFYKQLVRPHIALQFLIVPISGFGLVLCQSLCERKWNSIQLSLSYIVCGAAASLFIPFHLASERIGSAKFKRIFQSDVSAGILVVESKKKIDALLGEKGGEKFQQAKKIFVLGDSAFWYILKPQEIPPYISFYDMSPLYAQKRMLEWLEVSRPDIVLWDAASNQFDGVSNTVRCPLIFQHIFENYKLDDDMSLGRFRILNRIERPLALMSSHLGSWENILGNQVDYGFIPSAVSSLKSGDGEVPVSAILVSYVGEKKEAQNSMKHEVTMLLDFFDGRLWKVRFFLLDSIPFATVRLDRLWFYPFYSDKINSMKYRLGVGGNADFLLEKAKIKLKSNSLY